MIEKLKTLSDKEAADSFVELTKKLRLEIAKVIVGQEEIVLNIINSIFCNGHSLLIGVPGLAKTLLVKTISDALGLHFSRIQFTPDLMPSDITGSEILDEHKKFVFIKGPIFANLLLADEINRTPPKTQSALLESMQEHTVTVSGQKFPLPNPFFVLATQNPIEQEGTYPLPEAQLDRFMFSLWLDYPTLQEELQIVENTTSNKVSKANTILDADSILFFQDLIRKVPITPNVLQYAVELTHKTRINESSPEVIKKYISWGAGPRASQYLVLGAKCHALLKGKYAPDIEDVRAIAVPVLRHRIVKNYKAEADGKTVESIIQEIF